MDNELDYETLKRQRFPMDKLNAPALQCELVVRYDSDSLEKLVMGAQVNLTRAQVILGARGYILIPREFVANLSRKPSGYLQTAPLAAKSAPWQALHNRSAPKSLTLNGVNGLFEVVPTGRFAEPNPFTLIPFHAYGYYKIDWGPVVGGVCERIKLPVVPTVYTQRMDGMINILPELKDQQNPANSALEIVVALERRAMARFRICQAGIDSGLVLTGG
ncbi:hypothetical protein BDR22DRAFT_918511 [Usnea florida]